MASIKRARRARGEKSEKQSLVWNALQVTGQLIGHLKNVQLAYIRVGAQLVRVRDEKLYEILKHPDLEDYAAKRLDLSKTSLYRYIRIHDWVAKNRPEWLLPKPKGRIPDLAEISDAIRIDDVLRSSKITPAKRQGLEELKQQTLDGKSPAGAVAKAVKKDSKVYDSLKTFTSALRNLRRRGAALKGMPPEVISYLDSAIGILTNENAVACAGLHLISLQHAPDSVSMA